MNSLIEDIKIRKALKAKSSAGRNSLRLKPGFEENFVPDIAGSWIELKAKILSAFYLDFRVCFACYPPEPFKIICLTCIWLKFVDRSFHYSQKPPQILPPLYGHFFLKILG